MKIETDGKLHHDVPLIMVVLVVAVEFYPFKLANICTLEIIFAFNTLLILFNLLLLHPIHLFHLAAI